ncbi:MAG: DUF2974 domain-containing protein [Clostridiales bacterium]|nr:DUF2974 domain-containing protein [Candidatus Cacconaster stercorequi]
MAEKNEHGTVFDYLRWRGDLTFAQDGFNEVDNLILCIICYLNFHRFDELRSKDPNNAVKIGDISRRMTEKDEQLGLSWLEYIPLMEQAAKTKRFEDVALFGFEDEHDEDKEMQFQALSFLLPDDSVFVSYMGTDTSLVGWKENFNMSFLEAVPAQERAVAYAEEIARACSKRMLRIGGHSKGGNLAAWAAIHLAPEIRDGQLTAVYNNDGPGFCSGVLDTEAYQAVASRLQTYIPESSIVGVLLEHAEDYEVIDSTNRAVLQHEPLSWSVEANHFVHLGQRSQLGQLSDGVLQEWVGSMTAQERQEFTDALFTIFSADNKIRTLDDLRTGGLASRAALLRSYIGADEKKKKIINEIFHRLAVDVREELRKATEEELKNAKETIAGWHKQEK